MQEEQGESVQEAAGRGRKIGGRESEKEEGQGGVGERRGGSMEEEEDEQKEEEVEI